MAYYSRALCILFVLSLASCKQGVGERCQIVSDCEPGLICEESAGAGSEKICKSSEMPDEIDGPPMPMVDSSGQTPDADTTDADTTDADTTDADTTPDAP